MRTSKDGIGAVELVALALVAVTILALWTMQMLFVPVFSGMFADFGGELPAIARAAQRYLIAGGATVLSLALAAVGVGLRRGRHAGAWIALASAVAIPPLGIVLLWVALYAPIFEIAGRISD